MEITLPSSDLPLVVVIGAGFAGIEFTKALPEDRFRVLLLDKNNYHTFQPLLYQVAIGGLEPDSIAYPTRKIFSGKKNFYFRIAKVESVNPATHEVHTDIGSIRYDYLVIATGSKTNYFGLKDIEQHAMPLKSVTQALDLRSVILQNLEAALQTKDAKEREALMSIVVVGGGPTGIETAGALTELKHHIFPRDYPELDLSQMHIYIVEAAADVLGTMHPASRKATLNYLKKLGVNIWLNTSVQTFDGRTVKTKDERTITAKTVIWSAGVAGALINGLNESSIEKGRLITDTTNKVAGYTNIYALGDIALLKDEKNPKGYPMLAPVAIQQGKHLAKNFIRMTENKEMKPFSYFDKGTMATIGRAKAVMEIRSLRFHGFIAWVGWLFVHLMYLVGFRNRVIVFINWMWNYIRYDSAIRLIIRPVKK